MRVKKSKVPTIIIVILVVVVVFILFKAFSSKKSSNYDNMSDEEIEATIQEKISEMTVEKLSNMGERDRMEYYVSLFIKALESKNYDAAYDMLYDEFKSNYFPTLNDFEEYAKSKIPSMIGMEYTNIERNDNIYVMWVTISNPLAGKSASKEMNFVVQENGLNDFKLSFSVI